MRGWAVSGKVMQGMVIKEWKGNERTGMVGMGLERQDY